VENQESQDIMFCDTEKLSGVSVGRVQGLKPGSIVDIRESSWYAQGNNFLYNRPAERTSYQSYNALYVVSIDPQNQIIVVKRRI